MDSLASLANGTQLTSRVMNLSDYSSDQYGSTPCSDFGDNLYDYPLDSLYEFCSPVPGYCATIPRNHSSCKEHREEYLPLYRLIGTVFQSFTLIIGKCNFRPSIHIHTDISEFYSLPLKGLCLG